jgi:hypothetical protein
MKNLHYAETKAQKMARYMADFQSHVETLCPSMARCIEWSSAQNAFYTGQDAKNAAAAYVSARQKQG